MACKTMHTLVQYLHMNKSIITTLYAPVPSPQPEYITSIIYINIMILCNFNIPVPVYRTYWKTWAAVWLGNLANIPSKMCVDGWGVLCLGRNWVLRLWRKPYIYFTLAGDHPKQV